MLKSKKASKEPVGRAIGFKGAYIKKVTSISPLPIQKDLQVFQSAAALLLPPYTINTVAINLEIPDTKPSDYNNSFFKSK